MGNKYSSPNSEESEQRGEYAARGSGEGVQTSVQLFSQADVTWDVGNDLDLSQDTRENLLSTPVESTSYSDVAPTDFTQAARKGVAEALEGVPSELADDISGQLRRIEEQVESTTAGSLEPHLEEVDGEQHLSMTFSVNVLTDTDTFHHEVGHGVHQSQGYFTASQPDYDLETNELPAVDLENPDGEFLVEYISVSDQGSADISSLVDEVNDVFAGVHLVANGVDDWPDYIAHEQYLPRPADGHYNYYASNAAEYFAAFHETFQAEFPDQPATWFFKDRLHDLTREYTAVFDPSEEMQQIANTLHDRHSEISPWESQPFPDAGVDDDVVTAWESMVDQRMQDSWRNVYHEEGDVVSEAPPVSKFSPQTSENRGAGRVDSGGVSVGFQSVLGDFSDGNPLTSIEDILGELPPPTE